MCNTCKIFKISKFSKVCKVTFARSATSANYKISSKSAWLSRQIRSVMPAKRSARSEIFEIIRKI
jgi:hypothetical protein